MGTEILKNVKWGRSALSLLSHFEEINENYPTALLIRHSARYYPKDLSQEGLAELTPEGEKAAFEFGSMLPAHLKYRMFSSPSPRCKNTSRNIQAGIKGNGGIIESNAILSYIQDFHVDVKQLFKYIKRDGKSFIIRWVSGFYPVETILPSIEAAMTTLRHIRKNMSIVGPKAVDIHVSHDIYVAGTIFHLIGSLDPKYPVQYLDGFLMQIVDDQIHIYHKNGIEKVYLPYWWEVD